MGPLLLWLTLAARPTVPSTVAVYEPELALHREVVERLVREQPWIMPIPRTRLSQSEIAPKTVIALGDEAAARVRTLWPDAPVAAALVWRAVEADLVMLAHPDVSCTIERLAPHAAPRRWLVLAAPDDLRAQELAERLGAKLVQGDAAQLHEALQRSEATHVWLRAAPSLALPAWLEQLGRLNRVPGLYVGGDASGLARFGIDTPVRIDEPRVAARLRTWLRRSKAPLRRRPKSVEAAPCAPI